MSGTQLASLVELCERSCSTFAARPLFGVKAGESWSWLTYGDFHAQVAAARGGLSALGVRAGDTVAIVADNRVEWAAACYATYGRGAAYVPMYQAQHPSEWQFILRDCGARVVLAATDGAVARLRAMRDELPALEHVVALDAPAERSDSWGALLAAGRARPVPPVFPAPVDTAGLIYTSGTTGMPKGVILSHANITSNINAIHEVFTFSPDDRSLAFLPWAHSFGQTCELHGLVSMGCSIAVNDDVKHLIPNLAAVQPTVLFAVPRIFNRIYDGVRAQIASRPAPIQWLFARGVDAAIRRGRGESPGVGDQVLLALADRLIFSTVRARFGGRLRYAVSGSAALAREVGELIDALGITVYEGYGLTETSPIATANHPGARKLGSVGRAIPHVRIEIDASVTGGGPDGEVIVHGPNVMQGYHERPEETAAALRPDGALRTGDLGRLDEEGYLWITGRIKEQYKLENGKYVVPAAIEEKLKLSPFIANIFVYGDNRPHNVALIVPDPDALRRWAEERRHTLGDLAQDPRVVELLERELEAHSGDIKGFERVKAFAVVSEDFTTENGLLTPSLKLKRRKVMERYGDDLARLY
ncbi:MAG: long-chain fatty acid--CoA ligase [bacterium]|nr:long-chain fatty acid--CoA ligase [bacterium]